jgi:acyl transferase domain-containing protein
MNQREYTGLEVAIVGMSCRLPGASNIHEFWENLKSGKKTTIRFTDKELEEAGIAKELINDPNYVKVKGYLNDTEYFDARFFGYTDKEASILDPQVRVLHECAYEALEDAGYDPERFDGLIGFYAGALANYLWEQYAFSRTDGFNEQFDAIHLIDKDFLSSRVSYKLRLRGPSISLMTACSTSLTAIHMACRALLMGECRMAMAGGVSIMLPAKSGYFYKEGTMLSPDGECRAFDKNAVGTCGGDGAGIVVLKLLEDAIEDGDHIYAVIKGSAIHTDGARTVSYTTTNTEGIEDVMVIAQNFSRVEPETISYIEAHGIGTPLGDAIEIEGMKQAFKTSKKAFCAVGSLKPNIGYLGPASGITALIKAALAIHHRLIPPSLNYELPNAMIDFENSPFYVNTTLKEWDAGELPLRAGINSFGVGGSNAHIILEEAPLEVHNQEDTGYRLLLLSAKGQAALEKATSRLFRHINENPGQNLDDIAYTLQVGRRLYGDRRAVLFNDRETVLHHLEALNPERTKTFSTNGEKYSCVFMFSNLGSQYIHMGQELYKRQPLIKQEVDICSNILKPLLGYELTDILFPASSQTETVLKSCEAHLMVFIIQYALAKLLLNLGIMPTALIGHGVGEYAAACISGIFSLEQALKLVFLLGTASSDETVQILLDIYAPKDQVMHLIKEGITIAAVNTSGTCTVKGNKVDVDMLKKSLEEIGIDFRRLPGSTNYNNTNWNVTVLKELGGELDKITFKEPMIPIIPASGFKENKKSITDIEYWKSSVTSPIDFSGALRETLKEENVIFVEIGPGKDLTKFVQQHEDKKRCHWTLNLIRHRKEDISDIYQLLNAISTLWCMGVDVDWEKLHVKGTRKRVSLPTYPFQHQHFRI